MSLCFTCRERQSRDEHELPGICMAGRSATWLEQARRRPRSCVVHLRRSSSRLRGHAHNLQVKSPHRSILNMHASGAAGGEPELLETWIVMSFCDQGTLEQAIRQGRFARNLARPMY